MASAGQFDGQGDSRTPKPYVRQAFRKYLDCGIFARGFARAWCDDCGHDYFVAYSCKGRGVCPSCNTRRMVETAAHLTDHVFPRLAVRQWVLSVPKRLRYFMQRDGVVLNMVLRIFWGVIAQSLQSNSAGAVNVDKATLHIGAVAFIHRCGSSLNEHVHFHVCVVDGVFEEVADNVIFHSASGIDAPAVAQVQATLRRRILRAFVGRGLLRYCARPAFACERLRKAGSELVYRCAKQYCEPCNDKRGAKADELHLTPLGNAINAIAPAPEPVPPKRPAHYLWAVLIARIYEVFPLLCPICGGQVRIIAFITHSADIRNVLDHIGADSEPPRIAPAREPPLWDDCGGAPGEGMQIGPDWDLVAQPSSDYEVDQRINW